MVFLLMFFSLFANAQTSKLDSLYPELLDSINYYKEADKPVEQLARHFKLLRTEIKKSKQWDLYLQLQPYLDMVVHHPQADSILIRKQYLYYAYPIYAYDLDLDLALKYYNLAHLYGGNLDKVDDFWYVENILGVLYNIKQDFERSEYFYKLTIKGLERLSKDRSLEMKKRNKFSSLSLRASNNLGLLYFFNISYNKSLKIFRKNIVEARSQKNYTALAYAYGHLGKIYSELHIVDSIRRYNQYLIQTIPLIEEEKQKIWNITRYKLQGEIARISGNISMAIQEYSIALEKMQSFQQNRNTRDFAKIYYILAELYLKQNDLEKANTNIIKGFRSLSLDKSKVQSDDPAYLYPEITIADLLFTNADYYKKLYDKKQEPAYLDTAIMNLKNYMFVLDMLRDEYIMNGAKLTSIAENRIVVEKAIDLFYEKKQNNKGQNIVDDVEILFDRSKNLLLADINNERQDYRKLSDETKSRIKNLRFQIQGWTDQLSNTYNENENDSLRAKILENRIEIKNILKTNSHNLWERLQGDYIEYLVGKEYVYRIDNIAGKKTFERLGKSKELKILLKKSQKGILEKDNSKAFYEIQFQLYEFLFVGIDKLPEEFTIIADGLLNFLSFPSLITKKNTRQYMVLDHIVKVAYNKKQIPVDNKNFSKTLLVISPDYPKSDTVIVRKRGGIYHLPFVAGEIKSIRESWTGDFHSLDHITKKSFFENLNTASVVHYAGHAIVDGNDAFLALSADTATWVKPQEIALSDHHIQTIILSACETGLGELRYGEGVNSLAMSFLYSGVQSIIYSLWTVNDQTTAGLMSSFYSRFSKGKSISSSLALAQRDHLEKYKGEYAHPYYWAAFVVVEQNRISEGNNKIFLPLGLLFILILALIVVIYIKNRPTKFVSSIIK